MRTSGRGPARPRKKFSAAEPRRTATSSGLRRLIKESVVDAPCMCDARFTVSAYPETPNQPPEPTRTAVTSRADARLAPAARVAHL